MASHFEARGAIFAEDMEWPRKSREGTSTTDLSTFIWMP